MIVKAIDFCDRDQVEFIKDCHCKINYECESVVKRPRTYKEYAKIWFLSGQVNEYLDAIESSIQSHNNMGVICFIDDKKIGYMWVENKYIEEYNLRYGRIVDLYVSEEYRRNGIACILENIAERFCQEKGSTIIRSGTGAGNIASIGFHKKRGYNISRYEFEKNI